MLGEVQRGLAGGVPAADDEDVLAGHRSRLASRRPVEDAGADQRSRGCGTPRRRQSTPVAITTASADSSCPREVRTIRRSPSTVSDRRVCASTRSAPKSHTCSHASTARSCAADPVREAEVVADQRARPACPPVTSRLEQSDLQALGSAVDAGRQPGGPGADHDDVVGGGAGPGSHPDGLEDLHVAGVRDRRPVVANQQRQPRPIHAGVIEQLASPRPIRSCGRRSGSRCGSACP